MSGFSTNIEQDSLENSYFRKVIYTAPNLQVVLMTLQPGEEIGLETHEHGDQFFRVEAGDGEALIGGETHKLSDGISIVIPAGEEHNVINTSKSEPLRMYTIYTPPEHADGTIHQTKAEADAAEHDH